MKLRKKEDTMKIVYHNKKVEKICEDDSKAVKELGRDVATKLSRLLDAIEAFSNMYDLFVLPQYRLHALHGDRVNQYSFVIHKGSKWRLIVYPLDESGKLLEDKTNEKEMLIKAVMVDILEVSEHYD